jgi:hypothetical protein
MHACEVTLIYTHFHTHKYTVADPLPRPELTHSRSVMTVFRGAIDRYISAFYGASPSCMSVCVASEFMHACMHVRMCVCVCVAGWIDDAVCWHVVKMWFVYTQLVF